MVNLNSWMLDREVTEKKELQSENNSQRKEQKFNTDVDPFRARRNKAHGPT